jgi:hypothetical protein
MTDFRSTTGPSYNELVEGLERAKKQIESGYMNRTDAENGTVWLKELISRAEGENLD